MQQFHTTLTVSWEKSKRVPFTSSRIRNIIEISARSRFTVKIICGNAFGSTSSACCLLKSIITNLFRQVEMLK